MSRILIVALALALLIAGCASAPPKPANDSPKSNGSAMESGGDTITLGNGSMGSGTSDEDKVVSGGSIGMKKNNSTVTSGSTGGQIVDVGGSIPVR
ncbi:MAG TPA: hypothetical protein VLD37_04655 [Candidatus Bilamarchaeum sp.]|nr:hypothetical protein [Candidatus Bilamarchaeum sp.]